MYSYNVYDSCNWQAWTAILKEYRVPQQLVHIIEVLSIGTQCQVETARGTSEDFKINTA